MQYYLDSVGDITLKEDDSGDNFMDFASVLIDAFRYRMSIYIGEPLTSHLVNFVIQDLNSMARKVIPKIIITHFVDLGSLIDGTFLLLQIDIPDNPLIIAKINLNSSSLECVDLFTIE